ncbi:U5 small nuclear ribonucleoprotein helicase [Tanacetum coccineum]
MKEKGPSMDDDPNVGNGGEASGFVTSNVADSPSLAGKRVAYPIVENYTCISSQVWVLYEAYGCVLFRGGCPWLIHYVLLILKQWTPDANIMKEDVCNTPIWLKFHDFPITTFIEDGLSRASYARAMIELKVDVHSRDTIVVDVPKFSDEGFTMSTIHVEYKWAPFRCLECKNSKMSCQRSRAPLVGLKPKSTFMYRSVSTKKAAKANGNLKVQTAKKATTPILNSFDALSTMVDEKDGGRNKNHSTNPTHVVTNEASTSKTNTFMGDQLVESDKDKVELPNDESSRYMSLIGGAGFYKDDLDFYDGYEAQVYDLPEKMQTFCDQFDIRLRCRVRK